MISQEGYNNQESRAQEDESADDGITVTADYEIEQEEIITEPMWLAEHGPIALKVYKDVWKEFFDFETQYCDSVLKNLSRGGPGRRKQDPPAISSAIYTPSNSNYTCKIVDISEDGHTAHVTTVPMDPTVLDDTNFTIPEPYPRYTTCTPLSHNINLLNPDMDTRAQFLPYADEPEFLQSFPDYLDDFDVFAWQVDLADPDREMIEIEAARRLYTDYGYSYEEIDKIGMFKHKMLEKSKESLVWHAFHRDPFRWPGGTSTLQVIASQERDTSDKDGSSSSDGSDNIQGEQSTSKTFPKNTVDHSATFYEEVIRGTADLCPRLSCVMLFCEAHEKPPPIVPPKVTVKGQKMLQGKSKACGVDCFKTVDIGCADQENAHWTEDERSLFESVLKLTPDTLPCDLAIIYRKPCFEMYIGRMNILPDDGIKPERDSEPRPTFAFANPKFTKSSGPCSHQGPCNRLSNCVCFRNKERCQRSCRCSLKCKIRRKGCKCNNRSKISAWKPCVPGDDELSQCECAREGMECDPELCLGCEARGMFTLTSGDPNTTYVFYPGAFVGRGRCQNVNLQKGEFLKFRIMPSKYGLGAFAIQDMKAGDYIGEYTGEHVTEKTAGAIDPLQKYSDLNYAFGVYDDDSLDSWHAGNETRYLNDMMIVDYTPRIVIETLMNIEAGEELTLDYGDAYWVNKTQKEPEPFNEEESNGNDEEISARSYMSE